MDGKTEVVRNQETAKLVKWTKEWYDLVSEYKDLLRANRFTEADKVLVRLEDFVEVCSR